MKNTVMRLGWLLLLIAMTVGSVLAQEGEAAEAASEGAGPGAMIGVFILGGAVIVGVGLAMSSSQFTEDNDD